MSATDSVLDVAAAVFVPPNRREPSQAAGIEGRGSGDIDRPGSSELASFHEPAKSEEKTPSGSLSQLNRGTTQPTSTGKPTGQRGRPKGARNKPKARKLSVATFTIADIQPRQQQPKLEQAHIDKNMKEGVVLIQQMKACEKAKRNYDTAMKKKKAQQEKQLVQVQKKMFKDLPWLVSQLSEVNRRIKSKGEKPHLTQRRATLKQRIAETKSELHSYRQNKVPRKLAGYYETAMAALTSTSISTQSHDSKLAEMQQNSKLAEMQKTIRDLRGQLEAAPTVESIDAQFTVLYSKIKTLQEHAYAAEDPNDVKECINDFAAEFDCAADFDPHISDTCFQEMQYTIDELTANLEKEQALTGRLEDAIAETERERDNEIEKAEQLYYVIQETECERDSEIEKAERLQCVIESLNAEIERMQMAQAGNKKKKSGRQR